MNRVVLASAIAVTSLVASAPAIAAVHRLPETRTVCAKSAWIEDAPAHRPHGIAYRHDGFLVARYVHTAHKGIWAQGRHLNNDHSSGWIRASAFCRRP